MGGHACRAGGVCRAGRAGGACRAGRDRAAMLAVATPSLCLPRGGTQGRARAGASPPSKERTAGTVCLAINTPPSSLPAAAQDQDDGAHLVPVMDWLSERSGEKPLGVYGGCGVACCSLYTGWCAASAAQFYLRALWVCWACGRATPGAHRRWDHCITICSRLYPKKKWVIYRWPACMRTTPSTAPWHGGAGAALPPPACASTC